MRRFIWLALLVAMAPALGGCWEVIGESFTGYVVDAGDAGDAGPDSP